MIPGIVASAMIGGGVVPPDPPSADWAVLAHMSAPVDGAFDLTGLDLSGFQRIVLALDGVVPDTDNTELVLHAYIDGALKISGYSYRIAVNSSDATTDSVQNLTATGLLLTGRNSTTFGVGNAAGESFTGLIEIAGADASPHKLVTHRSTYVRPTGAVAFNLGGGAIEYTGTLTGLVVAGIFGLIASGQLTVYSVPSTDRVPSPQTPALRSLWVGGLT